MRQNIFKYIYLTTFLAALLVPSLGSMVLFSQEFSDSERRALSKMPGIPKNFDEIEKFPNRFENYFKDNFAFRNRLLNLFYSIKYHLRDSSNTDVIYGNDSGWLFYNELTSDPVGDYRNIHQFSPQQLSAFVANLKIKQSRLAKMGITYLFVLTPSKHYIYPEFLPTYIEPINQNNFKIQLKNALKHHPEINYLDLTEQIQQAKNEQLLYFKADTHWNYYAGNIAQFEIMKLLKRILPKISVNPRFWTSDSFKFQWNHQGDLAFLLRVGKYFEEPIFKPKFDACAEVDFALTQSSNSEYTTICSSNDANALVFHDSFFNLIQPYLSSQLKEVHYIKKPFTFKKADQYFKTHKVNVVIEQMVDRFLPSINNP